MAAALLSNEIYDPPTAEAKALPAGATPAGNTAAVQTIVPSSGKKSVAISGVMWSYSGNPTGGNLQISDGNTVVKNIDIPSGGQNWIPFPVPLRATQGNTLTLTLAAGGNGVSGKVDALTAWEV